MNANDHFPYILDRGHWIREVELEERLTIQKVVENTLGVLLMVSVLVLVMMVWLCF